MTGECADPVTSVVQGRKHIPSPFPRRLADGGLRALVAAPLQIESQVFGVLISARRQPNSFSSGECEFLRQLSEHVALAAHQAQLHGALQTAYEELRSTQQSVMQQERLRVLGQMASGIAHDINNAISPIALYTDSMLEREPGLSERGRGTRRRCLEPFFTTKGERGTGLGLAMVYGVMQRHGGELEIDSAPGFGTTVRMCFAPASETQSAATAVQLVLPVGLRILLIDDDPILLKSLRETLEQDGHSILTANGGKQGLDLFHAAIAGQPGISVVITDLGMPHVDGRSVARGVKRASRETPVILLTGWGERLLAEGDAPANVDRVLSKPPRLRELRKALAELTAEAATSEG